MRMKSTIRAAATFTSQYNLPNVTPAAEGLSAEQQFYNLVAR